MPSTYSTNLRLELQADGENSNVWGQKANTVFQLIETAISGYTSISVAGAVDVTLTANSGIADQARNAIIVLTGVLTGNINVIVPTAAKRWLFVNSTTGAFTLTVKTASGTGITIPNGSVRSWLFCDGTNVLDALSSYAATTATPIGKISDYAGTAAPSKWLLCFGQNISRTTYSALFAVIGTNFGVGDGSTTFGVPDLRGRTSAGKDDMGGSAASRLTNAGSGVTGSTLGAAGGDQLLHAHNHTQQGSFASGTVSLDHTHTQTGTFTSGGYSADHSHSYTTVGGGQNFNASAADTFAVTGSSAASTGGSSSNHTHNTTISGQTGGISANHTHTTTISGSVTTSGAGAGQNMPPVLVLNKIIYAGV